jgi:hypothetical protein
MLHSRHASVIGSDFNFSVASSRMPSRYNSFFSTTQKPILTFFFRKGKFVNNARAVLGLMQSWTVARPRLAEKDFVTWPGGDFSGKIMGKAPSIR